MKTDPQIDQGRIQQSVRTRFNPLRSITPELLVQALDNWGSGYLRPFAYLAHLLIERDDCIRSVSSKRYKAAARNGWEIVTVDKSPEAAKHAEVLKKFWDNITVTTTLEQDEWGGLSLLARQMMHAVGVRYAVHEIVWRPSKTELSAEFRFCPLWFFEATTGRLRFLKNDYDVTGDDLAPGGWLVTVGDGLMLATAATWMFRRLPLNDWLIYGEKFGIPGVHGKTSAAPGSDGWTRMEEAVAAFTGDMSIVTSTGEEIALIERKGSGDLPYPGQIERAERWISTLWRGGDLGTMSKDGQAVGSNPQQDETALLEQDDRNLLAETLNSQVEKLVIEWYFGAGVKPLAYLKFSGLNARNTELDIKVDEHLVRHGVDIGQQEALERFNRAPVAPGELALKAPAAPAQFNAGAALANERDFAANSRQHLLKAVAADLAPLRSRLAAILKIKNPDVLQERLTTLRAELKQIKADISADPQMAKALEEIMSAAVLNGMSTTTP